MSGKRREKCQQPVSQPDDGEELGDDDVEVRVISLVMNYTTLDLL